MRGQVFVSDPSGRVPGGWVNTPPVALSCLVLIGWLFRVTCRLRRQQQQNGATQSTSDHFSQLSP